MLSTLNPQTSVLIPWFHWYVCILGLLYDMQKHNSQVFVSKLLFFRNTLVLSHWHPGLKYLDTVSCGLLQTVCTTLHLLFRGTTLVLHSIKYWPKGWSSVNYFSCVLLLSASCLLAHLDSWVWPDPILVSWCCPWRMSEWSSPAADSRSHSEMSPWIPACSRSPYGCHSSRSRDQNMPPVVLLSIRTTEPLSHWHLSKKLQSKRKISSSR